MSTDFAGTATTVEEFAVGRRINRRLNALLPDKVEVFGVEINGRLPEKVAIKGLHRIREQASRRDLVGTVARRTLRIFNGSFKTIARTAAKLEEASQPKSIRRAGSRPATNRSGTRAVRRRAA